MTSQTTAARSAFASPSEEEHFFWQDMPFVINGKTVWPAVRVEPVEGEDRLHAQCAEQLIGRDAAMQLIAHLRRHGIVECGGRMIDVARAMIERGRWGNMEIGFFSALGQFIGLGQVATGDFEARPDEPRRYGTAPHT